MKKILILANDTSYTYNLRDKIIEYFIEQGFEVSIASQILNYQEELNEMGCRLIDLKTNRHGMNPFSDFVLFLKIISILRSEKPDVVLTYNIKPNVYGGLACRITKTHYLSNITGLGTAVEKPGTMQFFTKWLYKIGVAGADTIFFQNNDNLTFFKKNKMVNKRSNTVLLPGSGVNLKKHKPIKYPEDTGETHFLFIARVMKEKGIDLYLNAAKRIFQNHKNVIFHVCGYCDNKKYIQILHEAEKDGHIKYHGEQKKLYDFFEQANCIVHPSSYPEGMSNVLLEAAAHARPVITTDRAGCRETIDNSKSGIMIPINDEDALVAALEQFLNMSWTQKKDMGIAGREKMEREFDRMIVVRNYYNVIQSIVS